MICKSNVDRLARRYIVLVQILGALLHRILDNRNNATVLPVDATTQQQNSNSGAIINIEKGGLVSMERMMFETLK